MFKKIRVLGISMLVFMALLILTITPVFAGSSTLSAHEIAGGAGTTYWSGSGGCHNVIPWGMGISQKFASYATVRAGHWTSSEGYVFDWAKVTDTKSYSLTDNDGPHGVFKFYVKNYGSNTIECTSGTIRWGADFV